MLTSGEIESGLSLGYELRELEVKGPGLRTNKATSCKVTRAALSKANLRDGCHVVIGINDTQLAAMPGLPPDELIRLVDVPTNRLVVIDYAESRAKQLEVVFPALAGGATPEHPVRVVLLVGASRAWFYRDPTIRSEIDPVRRPCAQRPVVPPPSAQTTESLRQHSEALSVVPRTNSAPSSSSSPPPQP